MKYLAILPLFLSLQVLSCTEVALQGSDQVYKVCFKKGEPDHIYTKGCENASCFPKLKGALKTSPDQNPLFSLCYQLESMPFFGKISNEKESRSFCLKDRNVVDLNHLFRQNFPR